MRPSIATTATPSTTRSVIFSATVHPPDERFLVNLHFQRRRKSASIIVRAGQVIPALPANQLATLGLQPLGTNRAETDGMLRNRPPLAGISAMGAAVRIYLHSSLHGPKVIAQPG
jgi:hypothetical protein